MKIAVVGATGLVGSEMIKVLEEQRYIPLTEITEFYPVASARSVGKEIKFNGKAYKVIGLEDAVALRPDVAIFSAGASTSLAWAPKFAEVGTFVVDNSSCWRMEKNVPLIVPEINANILTKKDKIIANPNCSTIQLVMALAPLHKAYKIDRLVVSTYQSVTGTGVKAVKQLNDERQGLETEKAYPYTIDMNLFPHGGSFLENGYTTEEQKLVDETRKILGDQSIRITSTVVRVPVVGGHSETANIEFENEFDLAEARKLLEEMPGVIVQDDPATNFYPMPLFSHGKDEVFVGRIRRDESNPKTLNLWVVADNLRKGAATNAVQIAAYLKNNNLL
ncbi:MAG: aspartate-semialdehyde dehydrogenase [Bacteroidetes bacterium]|nr:aspartate-semialdehyde dehydrogenase [Bacteroidota bacterium]